MSRIRKSFNEHDPRVIFIHHIWGLQSQEL